MRKILLGLLFTLPALGQVSNPSIITVTSAPSGACTSGLPNQQVSTTGVQYSCQGGTWGTVGTGAGGPPTGAAGGALSGTYPNPTAGVAIPPNMAAWYVSSNCGTQTNCTQVYADTKYVVDATSNSTTTLTCPDCAFTQADVGKVAWATTQGTGVGVGYLLYTTFVCPQTTIASVTNSTTVVLANACTANGSGNVVFIWGHDDGAALATLDTAAGCNVIHIATGNTFIMDGQPFLVNAPTTCSILATSLAGSTGSPAPYLLGDGFGASQATIVPTPNFAFANCKAITGATGNVCIGGTARGISNVLFWATGLTSASNSNCANAANKIAVSASPASSVLYGVVVGGWCPGASGFEGIEINSYDENFDLGGVISTGQYACVSHGPSTQHNLRANDCRNDNVTGGIGLLVNNGAQVFSFSNYPMVNTLITGANSTLISVSSYFSQAGTPPAVEIANGSKFISYADTITSMLTIDTGGYLYTINGNINGFTNNGTIVSGGNNKYTLLPQASGASSSISGVGVLFGSCRGTATSSATLGLYGLGQFATPNCTSTVVNLGASIQTIPLSGSVNELRCTATHAGVSGSSGVVTVLKNGSSSVTSGPITCTIGTGTSCEDRTHYDIPVVGDVYSIQFTTQGSEVLAGVSCTLLNW